ncbi:unnamed protein product, partial [Phaeothamnion confervicola]
GFQSLLRTAWKALQENPNNGAAWLGMLMAVLSQSKQEDVLLSLLPFEGTRIDRLDEKGEDHSSTIVTLAGLTGFQGLFWNSLLNGPDGKPLPTREVAGETLILHPKAGQDSLMGMVTARVRGSFMAFSDLLTAQKTLNAHKPSGEVYDIATTLDLSQDTVGVLLNRKNSLMRFMTWLDGYDMHVIGDAVGQKRFKDDMDSVDYVTWT